MVKSKKEELEDKIKKYIKELEKMDDISTPYQPPKHPSPRPAWMKKEKLPFKLEHDVELEIGEDKFDTIREIDKAKREAIQRAGTIKTTEDGSVLPEDNVEPVRIPAKGIHDFTNLEECECECHPKKKDCIDCYDHPVHLDVKRKMREPDIQDEYDEEKILELIKADKAKNEKKHWWNK